MAEQPSRMVFQVRAEPRESAFWLLVPQGWQMEGGMTRANHLTQVVSAQSIEAKLDLSVKLDPPGTVMVRWCPEVKYIDTRGSMTGMMFPQGSSYQGMLVWPLMSAVQFGAQMLFQWAHPQAANAQLLEQQPQPKMAEPFARRTAQLGILQGYGYDAAAITYTYDEGGTHYKERAFVLIESLGPMTGGMWSNKQSFYLRAPADQFEQWEGVLNTIITSAKLNPQWAAQEQASQNMLNGAFHNAQQAEQMRAQRALETQRYLQDADRQIVEHRQQTYAEIRNDNYLTLTNQEEYVNPYTNQVDTGSNQWNHRWVTESGDVFYSNNESDNPNNLDEINQHQWQRAPVRPRFPQ